MRKVFPWVILSFVSFCFYSGQSGAQAEFFAKIRALKAEGKLDQALQMVEKSLEQHQLQQAAPGNQANDANKSDVRLLTMEKGLLAEDLGQNDKASDAFMSLITSQSNLTEYADYELAKMSFAQKDEKATLNFDKAILKLSPNMKMLRDVQLQMSKIYNNGHQFKDARVFLVKLEKKNRHEEFYPEIIYELARAERGLGNNTGFCKWARKLYAHFPEDSHIAQWGFHLNEDLFEDKPTKCSTTSEDHKQRIRNLQWAGLDKKALDEITQFKKENPDEDGEASQLEISYMLHQGEIEQALQKLKPLYEKRKKDPNFLNLIANAAAKMGDSEAAIGSYYSAYKQNPHGKIAKETLFQAAFMSYQFQDYDGASRKFQEFLKAFPRSAMGRDARWHLAWIRYLRGDYEGAFKALAELRDQAKKTRKTRAIASVDRLNFWSAMCLYRLNRYSEARAIFETLAQDKLMGYYSLASAARLKKLDALMPKAPRVMPDMNGRVSRISPQEALMPADDPEWFRQLASQKADMDDFSTPVESSLKGDEDSEAAQEMLSKEEGPDRGLSEGDSENAEGNKDSNTEEATNTVDDDDRGMTFTNPMLLKRFERARDLMTLGLWEWSRWDLFDIEKRTKNREYLKTLMQEYELVESYNRSSYIGQVSFADQRSTYGVDGARPLWEHTYPRAYAGFVNRYAREFGVPTELVWGIMRAESQYKRDVISPVGALGLMQIMPFTAQKVANLLGEKNFESKKLLQPESSVRIGSKYLQRLLKKFDGNLALVAAGYNAGPHRVYAWLSSFGQLDLDEFIEHIPYLETRNYVKKVLTHFMIYNRLYMGKKDSMLSLSDPLNSKTMESVLFKDNYHEMMKESWDDI